MWTMILVASIFLLIMGLIFNAMAQAAYRAGYRTGYREGLDTRPIVGRCRTANFQEVLAKADAELSTMRQKNKELTGEVIK